MVLGVAAYVLTRRKPEAEELERERRDLLARTGRITDGTILDTQMLDTSMLGTSMSKADTSEASLDLSETVPITLDEGSRPAPHLIVYTYRIAGVSYECAQDVTSLADYVHGIRSDLPIQVRYEPHNPGNSIVVAEAWSGLRLTSTHPLQDETRT